MSGKTKANLDDAIRAHVADSGDGYIITHWVLVAGIFSEDKNGTPFWTIAPDGQPSYINAGLLFCALNPDKEM